MGAGMIRADGLAGAVAAMPEVDGVGLAMRLASRMCHDLVSPLGAIGNGLELLEMAGGVGGAEAALISDSVAAARARVRLFRLAFGHSGPDQRLPVHELREVLADRDSTGRLAVELDGSGDLSRGAAQLIALSVMCLATGLPWGGRVLICRAETGMQPGAASGWRLVAESARTRPDPALWSWLDGAVPGPLPGPGEVHFAMLAAAARAQGRRLRWELDDSGAEISIGSA